ncbi:hypothetical protein J1N35_014620 [Gossypium stocksii]|uniref:Uncharacterized protein n=1 Tax=Gossypium stocksii TaxID=47602 RepID=A0A9D4A9J2_9ROSI|nr:hypothetical protein J1N35_014620 [Gossypium stocksii]
MHRLGRGKTCLLKLDRKKSQPFAHSPDVFAKAIETMIFYAHLLSRIVHFTLNLSDWDLTMWKFTPFLMLYRFIIAIKPSLKVSTSKSPKFNEELAWLGFLCGSSANSNASSVGRSILCMWVGGESALNDGSSPASSLGPSPSEPLSSCSVGTGSSLENNTISNPSAPGSQIGLASESVPSSFSTLPTPQRLYVTLTVDVVGSTSSLLV